MKRDNIHFTSQVLDGYNKIFNIVQSCRSSGKTTDILYKCDKAYDKYKSPTILLRRNIADITEAYIDDQLKVVNKFRDEDKKRQFFYKLGDIKSGVVDIYISSNDLKNKTNPYWRLIALSTKMQRLKGGVLKDISYLVFDEFMIDTRHKEAYLPDELLRFEELYTTYRREAKDGVLKCWFLGNAYSYYSPYHNYFKIPSNKIKMGALLSGAKWVYNLFKPSDQLIEELSNNPLFDINDKYEQYALYGIAVNDEAIQIEPVQPRNFALFSVFKVNDNLIGVYYNKNNEAVDFNFWCCELDGWKEEYRRKALAFNIQDMTNFTLIPQRSIISMLYPVKRAIMQRDIKYKTLGASYILEMIYDMLPKI